MTKEESALVFNELPKQLEEYGTPVLETDLSESLKSYKNAISKDENKELLQFLKTKLPQDDWAILNAAIYLREVFISGGSVDRIKANIINHYGNRGKNICNLCSAGYFETWIKPLFENFDTLDKENKEKTLRIYDMIVMEFPFAVFVNRSMTLNTVKATIREKFALNKTYGIKTLTIHGIGNENINKIEAAYIELKGTLEECDISVEKFNNIIAIRISYRNVDSVANK